MINNFFFRSENRVFYKICGKILHSWAGHRWQYGTCVLHAGYQSLQISRKNT